MSQGRRRQCVRVVSLPRGPSSCDARPNGPADGVEFAGRWNCVRCLGVEGLASWLHMTARCFTKFRGPKQHGLTVFPRPTKTREQHSRTTRVDQTGAERLCSQACAEHRLGQPAQQHRRNVIVVHTISRDVRRRVCRLLTSLARGQATQNYPMTLGPWPPQGCREPCGQVCGIRRHCHFSTA